MNNKLRENIKIVHQRLEADLAAGDPKAKAFAEMCGGELNAARKSLGLEQGAPPPRPTQGIAENVSFNPPENVGGAVKPRVHFIENKRRMHPIPNSSDWESGYWYRFGGKNAAGLIGGGIYFHTAQTEPSYDGGVITGYHIQPEGEFKGRYIFTYRPALEFVGISAGTGRWTWRYKKLVL
jgi:hypothetical protein